MAVLEKSKILFYFIAIVFLTGTFATAQEDESFELVSVRFHGNHSIPTSELQNVVSSKESPGWFTQFLFNISDSSFGEAPIYFDSLLIPGDMEAIKNYYWANGFFKSGFGYGYEFDSTDMEAVLTYYILESDPHNFKDFKITGLDQIPPWLYEDLVNRITIDTTERYSETKLEENRVIIIKFMRDHGYMLVNSDSPVIEIDTSLNFVDVTLNFTTGKRYVVSELRVDRTGEGKDLVGDELIKEIVAVKPGDWYSEYDLQRGQVRLYRTNLFTSALVSGLVSDTFDVFVPIAVNTDIGLLHELSPEIIVNNEDNAFNLGIGASFIKKNFFGDARKLTLSASAASQDIIKFMSNPLADTNFFGYADTRLKLEQPFLFGKPINTQLENYFTIQKRRNEYNGTIIGSKLTFDFEMPQYTYVTSMSTYLNWEYSKIVYRDAYITNSYRTFVKRAEPNAPAGVVDSLVNILKSLSTGSTSKSTTTLLGIDIGANRTDDLLFPTRGYALGITIEDGNSIPYLISRITGGKFDNTLYLKTLLFSSFYLPVYSTKTDAFGIKFKVGNIFNYRGEKGNIPLFQRFYSGGSNSVRGWNSRGLVPSEPPFDATSFNEDLEAFLLRGVTPGGFFLFEGSIETRNRLSEHIGSAIFIDYGNTWNSYKDFRPEDVAVAAGFGFRYYSDFAPIRLDFGFKAYNPNDRRSFFDRISSKGFWSDALWDNMEIQIGIGEAF